MCVITVCKLPSNIILWYLYVGSAFSHFRKYDVSFTMDKPIGASPLGQFLLLGLGGGVGKGGGCKI
jgi:hypothetical protein